MLSGAFDALALEKPLITSNWITLKEYFNKGTIHADNSSEQIRHAINTVQMRREEMLKKMHELKIEKIREWEEKFSKFSETLMGNSATKKQ
jgi:t-SNARE complex subunit (syntaxin)